MRRRMGKTRRRLSDASCCAHFGTALEAPSVALIHTIQVWGRAAVYQHVALTLSCSQSAASKKGTTVVCVKAGLHDALLTYQLSDGIVHNCAEHMQRSALR